MPYYCIECGGDLEYDPKLKQYICKSCGLSCTMQDLIEARDKLYDNKDDVKNQKQKEYLKWWLSKK